MTTEQIILIAFAVNFVIAVGAIVVPRIRHRRSSDASKAASSTPRVAAGGSAGIPADARPLVGGGAPAGGEGRAGAPWFPVRANGDSSVVGSTGLVQGFDGGHLMTDRETGLDLPPTWARWLAEEDARVRRFHRPATVVLVELSWLDRLADRLGDEAAQRLIPPIAHTMRRNARATDHLARLGPTLFGAILPETDEVRAINYIERVRSACDVWLEAGAVMLKLSVGWAEMSADRPAEVALPDAERRLYEERQRTWTILSRQAGERIEPAVLRSAEA
jgi:diguanylate cyclase (GGDEF)-like protein